MTDRSDENGAVPKNSRDERLSEALRANLRRRKRAGAGLIGEPDQAPGQAMARRDRGLQPQPARSQQDRSGSRGERDGRT